MNKTTLTLTISLLSGFLLTACESTTTTVVDGRTGRPLPGSRVVDADGTVHSTDMQGSVERGSGTGAHVSRAGYHSVTLNP